MTDVIIGVYNGKGISSPDGQKISEELCKSDLVLKAKWEIGKTRLTYLSNSKFNRVVLVGLGDQLNNPTQVDFSAQEKVETERLNSPKNQPSIKQNNKVKFEEQFDLVENGEWSIVISDKVREAIKEAVTLLRKDDRKITHQVFLDSALAGPQYEQQVVEGAVIGAYEFKLGEDVDEEEKTITIEPLNGHKSETWNKAYIYAHSQVIAARLTETPANLMTPTIFSNTFYSLFQNVKNAQVIIRDREWAQSMEMFSFLGVAQGSDEEPKILEVKYSGNSSTSDIDLILIGKGITFDSGGISLKDAPGMKAMKGDMGGAAAIMSALLGISQLGLPLNVVGLAFLCENMPSGKAVKPGDVIRAMNKKSIEVDNTDAEGRLILADALCYASTMHPKVIIDCATLTGAIVVALGEAASGVYTNSNELWHKIDAAGQITNDYMWRMPLFKEKYLKQLQSKTAKLNNVGGREGGSCTAATFLSEFVDFDKVKHWSHIDIAGSALMKEGMSGRPTRALIELAAILNGK
jgi:aminopeptidase